MSARLRNGSIPARLHRIAPTASPASEIAGDRAPQRRMVRCRVCTPSLPQSGSIGSAPRSPRGRRVAAVRAFRSKAVAVRVLAALAALVALALAACGASRPACEIAAAHEPHGAPFLWRVQRGDGPVLWLYGTFHNGHARVPPAADAALASAAHFASELGDTEPDPERLRELARLPRGKGLDALLPAGDWWDLRDALRGVVAEDVLARSRPWFAMTQLTSAMAPSPRPTMDVALATRARERKIPVDALETWEEQLTALDAAVTLADLQQAIHERKTMQCSIDRLLAAYAAGDLDAMGQLLGVAQSETLLAARNRKWLPALERYLAARGAFVAVGVSHLAGAAGLPALLARAGYTVERARP